VEYQELYDIDILSCVRLYGICEFDFFIELFNTQNPDEVQLNIMELEDQLDRCEMIGEEAVRFAYYIVSESLLMFDGDLEKLQTERAGKEFYIPKKEELLKYEDSYYVEKNTKNAVSIKMLYLKLIKFEAL